MEHNDSVWIHPTELSNETRVGIIGWNSKNLCK